jgi:PPOX class probable F420-dependent enzyme
MSDEELRAFLGDHRVVSVATIGPHGRPHLVPLWYAVEGATLRSWTYAKSQKAKNLERDPRATLQVEAGESYEQLRGVMLECDVTVHRDVDLLREFGLELYARYAEVDDGVRAMVDQQAPKRIGLQFVERSRATWDHRKLGGGVY